MTTLFKSKLENIHAGLLKAHHDSAHFESPINGAEREVVSRELLSLLLPSGYRVGTGKIIDQRGGESSQVDAVIEEPFSVSFPVVSEMNRLYLASTVSVAFEIKSDLVKQKAEALEQVRKIRSLRRYTPNQEICEAMDILIPVFIIAYKGPKTIRRLTKKYINMRDYRWPTGILVLDSEIFFGTGVKGSIIEANGKAECIFAFLACVLSWIQRIPERPLSVFEYLPLLKEPNGKNKDRSRKSEEIHNPKKDNMKKGTDKRREYKEY